MGSREQSTGARSILFNELQNLVTEKFTTLRAKSIQFGNTNLEYPQVGSALNSDSYIKHEETMLSLKSLSALFDVVSPNDVELERMPSSFKVSNPLHMIENIIQKRNGVLAEDDRVYLVYRLLNSISYFVSLQGFEKSGIHTLWVVYRSTEKENSFAFAIAPGAKPSLAWRLVEASAIPITTEKHPDDYNVEIMEASKILKAALSALMLFDPTKFDYDGLRNMRVLEDEIKSKEVELFTPIDGLPTAHYVLKSSMASAMSSCVSEHIEELKHNGNKGFSEIFLKLEDAEHEHEKQVHF